MKVAEINKLIKKHITSSLKEYFAFRNRVLTIRSEYFLLGYYFESRGDGEDDLAVWYSVQPLFAKADGFNLTLGDRMSRKRKVNLLKTETTFWWDARKENLDATFESILNIIKEVGEKKLAPIRTAEDFYKTYYGERRENIRVYESVAYSTVLFAPEKTQDEAIKGLIKFTESTMDDGNNDVEIQIKNDATMLLNAKTTAKRLEILKSWANETIGYLKVPEIKTFT